MKALMGSGTDVETLRLLDEIRTLRSRVQELEDALREAEAASESVTTSTVDVRGELVEAGATA